MSTDNNIRNKRKRKKTFLQNARKYAKKGYYGRGSHMDADMYQYFVRILEVFKQGFENNDDKAVFVDNVFEQTENKEIECSCNQVGCRVIEMLLPFASDDIILKYSEKFSADIRPLSKDRFASFVLQALVKVSCGKYFDNSVSHEQKEKFKSFAVKTSKFLLNNLEDYIWDTYGNHVIRTCLCSLLNIHLEDKKQKGLENVSSIIQNECDIPEEFIEIVKEYAQRLIIWPQFGELCNSEQTSGFLQVLLKVLKKTDSKLLKKYLDKILEENFLGVQSDIKSENLPQGFMSVSLLMLLETAIQVAGKKSLNKYIKKLFSNNLLKLALMRSTNFAVQKILTSCINREQFDPLFDELADHMWEIIEKGHPAVILALAQGCKKLSTKQGSFIQGLMKALNCLEPEENQNNFAICTSFLIQYDKKNPVPTDNLQKEKLNLQGTLILQLMLEFNKPIKIINSLLSLTPNDLKGLFSNTMGSHIVDSYMKSVYVGEKSREKLVRKMQGTYQDLASSKYGSRSFEAIWNVANMKSKIHIMEELSHRDGSWANTEYGKIISSKINLVLFKRNKESWKNSLNKVATAEEVLADVLK